MKPIINPWLFYFASVSDRLCILAVMLSIAFIVCSIIFLIDYGDGNDLSLKTSKKFFICSLISISIGVLMPSKNTIYEMVVANNITPATIEKGEEEIKDVVDYIVDKISEIDSSKKEGD